MKCLFCSSEIDETPEIDPEDVFAKRKHAAKMSEWEQVTVAVTDRGGSLSIFAGHVCPKEKLKIGDVAVVKSKKEI
jgi:hypothetical protein